MKGKLSIHILHVLTKSLILYFNDKNLEYMIVKIVLLLVVDA